MSTPGANYYSNRIVRGPFLADPAAADNYLQGPIQLDAAQFYGLDSVLVNVTTQANAAATSLVVTALSGPIPAGTLLDFGTNKFARVNTAAAKGAVSLTVDAIPTQINVSDKARYAGIAPKVALAGTLVGRTQSEADAGTAFGPAVSTDDYIYLTGSNVDFKETDGTLAVRHHRAIKENFLPNWATLSTDTNLLAKLRSLYECIKGQR